MWRWIGTAVLAAVAAFLLVATDGLNPVVSGDPAATRALDAVTGEVFDPADPAASFPADYQQVMGYLPVVATGPHGTPILIKKYGDCSGPIGRTRYDFDTVCKQHDLAYDVLRYAADIGRPLPAESRQAADAMFGRQLHARCDSLTLGAASNALCQSIAEGYGLICKFNGWRQGYRAPGDESTTKWLAVELVFFAIISGRVLYLIQRRHVRHRRSGGWHDFTFQPSWHHPVGTLSGRGLGTSLPMR